MTIDVAEEPMAAVAQYALLPTAFCVEQVLDVTARADGGFTLCARKLEVPYVKDYDTVDGDAPLHWRSSSGSRPGPRRKAVVS